MSASFDIVIIGGGIIGSAIAYALAADPDRPARIAVIERDPSYQKSSTVFATGVIRPQFSTPANIRMSLASLDFLRASQQHLHSEKHDGVIGLHEHPYMILVGPESVARFRQSHAAQMENGADVAFLTPDELAARYPLIATDHLAGGFLSATGAGSFDPWALLQAFRRKAIELGVEYIEDEAVDLYRTGRSIETATLASGNRIAGGTFINAAGARDAARIAALAGVPLPVEPRVRTTFYVGANEDLSGMPMIILPSGVWVRPEGKGFLCGLTPEVSRDEPSSEFTIDYDQFESDIWPLLAETVPAFEAVKMISAYCGHYDFNTLDENAIIGPVPQLDNFHVATGFSGHGVMHSPATGQIMADLVLRGRYGTIDAGVFGYDRVLSGTPVLELNTF